MNQTKMFIESDFKDIGHKIEVAGLELENSLLKSELKISEIRENLRTLREKINDKMHNV